MVDGGWWMEGEWQFSPGLCAIVSFFCLPFVSVRGVIIQIEACNYSDF